VRVDRLDHLVLTVASIEATVTFYTQILGMDAVTFGDRAHRQLLPARPGPQPHRTQHLPALITPRARAGIRH